jgi:hypothetical protein
MLSGGDECAEKPPCKVSMFKHPLVSNYILSVFSKLPVHPMSRLRHAREQVIYRVIVSTFSRRINARYIDGEDQFHAIEYEIADSSRESSCVVALTITAEPRHWQVATRVAVQVRAVHACAASPFDSTRMLRALWMPCSCACQLCRAAAWHPRPHTSRASGQPLAARLRCMRASSGCARCCGCSSPPCIQGVHAGRVCACHPSLAASVSSTRQCMQRSTPWRVQS